MNCLPFYLKDEILFKMDLKSLAKMRCTDKYFRSHISDDPDFKSEYYSRVGSNLLHMSRHASNFICYLPSLGSTSLRTTEALKSVSRVLGSSSGLLLLFFSKFLCVTNPLTKKFRFIDHSRSHLFPEVTEAKCIGFAVDESTEKFKIVYIKERRGRTPNEMKYQFEMYVGDSWRLSKTTVTCLSSDLDTHIKPVYVDGSLHWLRNDGSIIAFDPETEKARVIPIEFPQQPMFKTLLVAARCNELTLILPTKDVIYVYILKDMKWVLVRQIKNEVVAEKRPDYWDAVAYDAKCLMLRETKDDLVHRYDLRANKWAVMGSIPKWCDGPRDFYLFEPWHSSVMGLDKKEKVKKKLKPRDYGIISSLSSIMGLIGGDSSEKIEMQLCKGLSEEETPLTLKRQRTNRRRRQS